MMDLDGRSGNLHKSWRIARKLAQLEADAVIVEQHLPVAAAIAHFSSAKVLFHTHNYEKEPKSRLKRAIQLLKLRRLAGFIFVSQSCADHFHALYPEIDSNKIGVVHNGLCMADWEFPPQKDRHIVVVGRAIADKGHREAMEAILREFEREPDWTAQFILTRCQQEPDYFRKLRDAAERAPGRISIDSNMPYPKVKAAWARAAIGFVLTRTPEPFGRTALEALASGAALITSGLGGLAEVCGPHALVVDPAKPEKVSAALGRLMQSPELRSNLAKAGRARVEKLYDIRAVAARLDEFLDQILEGSGSALQIDFPTGR